ncbi:M23 family metallopeptidase [Microbacterium hominis]|uniref:M23 family metallopeptidase n=1 Tax=Microbacterium TaxID=33882 RepID=UPI00168B73DA|nr:MULTISPECIES: M23 family metallopeptidase [Microbacterium]QOC24403.1 M23 family metallopeptidase [Microbacterium hominis]QOC28481.1 M23 family metallopeptidase [Microbacterium hominis]QYF96316.1 M23 family metallopeptidase [Microbacterium sp. PAMC21962]
MRRPVDHAVIGDGTAEHALRGVDPAQDYPCPVGTPVYAPFAVVRIERFTTSAGGMSIRGTAANGDQWIMQHLSGYITQPGLTEGSHVAYSGNTGSATTGPHVHHYVILAGTRRNPEDAGLYDHPQTAGETTRPFEEDDMFTDDDRKMLEDVQRRIRGDNPDADMLQEIRERVTAVRDRVRGDAPNVDMLQDTLGQVEALRTELAALVTNLRAS